VKAYVDSSVVLRHILNADPVLGRPSSSDEVGSSDLLTIECQWVLQRERMAGHLDDSGYSESVVLLDALLDRLSIIELGPAVKRLAAGPFPTVIGTLDAIHLASALLWKGSEAGSELVILTYDAKLALCARSLGVRVA
jgi:predicted nucleic acid-binding protein